MSKNRFLNILILFLFFWISSGFSVAAQENKKQLVIINSYNEVAPWPRKYINKVIQDISARPDFNAVRVIHLNNSLIFNQDDYNNLVDMLFDNYTGEDPDYIVLVGAFAFNLRDKIKQVWGDVPMLLISQTEKVAPLDFYFTTLNTSDSIMPPRMTPMESLRDDYNFSVVLTPNKHKETVDMMIHMYPDMNKIVFMADGLYINHHLSYMLREYINLKYPNIDYEWLLAGEEGVMIPYLNNNDPNVGLLLSTWYYTAPGVSGLPLMSATDSFLINGAHRPVFGLRYAYMTYGILGGYFCSPDEIYNNVHDAVLDLISGKDMRDVPFRIPTEAYPYINYPKMISLDIPEDICPDNTVFVDRPITLWEEYGDYVIYGVGVLLVLLVVFLLWYLICKRNKVSQDYNSLVNSMPIGYMQTIVDLDKNGSVKAVHYGGQNKALKTMVEDHNLKSLKSEEYADIWQESIDALDSEEGPTGSIIKAPNEEVYLEFIVNPNKKSKENRMVLDVYAIDVTDKMKVEQVLRDAAKKAVEADNMKSAFLANMSHEIRTPLNAIVGFANLLCKTVDPEKKKKFVEIIETNNHLLLKLIGDILDISKADSNRMVFNMYTIDINKLLNTIVSGIDITKKPDVKIDVRLGMEKCIITSDPYRITQVINNLLTNAIKFTERGLITVGYELMPNNMLRFYVKDTGLGISQADLPKLFTRFTKLNSFIQGTGLGLSISKTIVEKLGGTMRAESAGRGKGSTFYFTIPYVLDETKDSYNQEYSAADETRFEALKKKSKANAGIDYAGKGGGQDPSMPSYKHERKKIMVVEDNESNSQLLDEILLDRYDVVNAKDGAESITVFARETPDLVLMDINLPIKDGYQATEEIRRMSKTVPIIAVTAYAQQSDRRKVMDSGFDGYLSKPIDENELFATIRRFL
ncbi:MAG: response regulator [Muribaculaceae bacterium]|nr:response regulator [Muribaculaceae bacterium]